jgi:hypothetical protein
MENLRNQITNNLLIKEFPKEFHLISLATLNTLEQDLHATSPKFALFLGMDARGVNDSTLMAMADKIFLLGSGISLCLGTGQRKDRTPVRSNSDEELSRERYRSNTK